MPRFACMLAAGVLLGGVALSGAVNESKALDALPQAAAAESSDWPQWRGAQRDGIARHNQWQTDWTAQSPPLLWTAEVGIGFSSVAVADGRAITLGHVAGDEIVYCFDVATGKELWRQAYPAKLVDTLHEGGPSATPTIDGERVFTLSKDGQLHALDSATGKVLWRVELDKLLEVTTPEWGFSSSALVLGDQLIFDAGPTVSLDKETGKLLWQTAKYRVGYGSPAAFQHDDKTLVAVLNNEVLLVVDPAQGNEVAKYEWKTDYLTTATTPIVHEDKIFISSGYRRGCALLRLSAGQLELVYENKLMSNHMDTCVLWEGALYGISGNTHSRRNCELVCLDFATGEEHWRQRGFGCGTVSMADGRLLVLGDEGELSTGPASTIAWESTGKFAAIEGRCWSPLTLAGNRIFIRNSDGKLVCYDASRR